MEDATKQKIILIPNLDIQFSSLLTIPESVGVEVTPLVDLVARLQVVDGRVELHRFVGVLAAEVAHQRHRLLVDHAVDDEEGQRPGGAVLQDLGVSVVLTLKTDKSSTTLQSEWLLLACITSCLCCTAALPDCFAAIGPLVATKSQSDAHSLQ